MDLQSNLLKQQAQVEFKVVRDNSGYCFQCSLFPINYHFQLLWIHYFQESLVETQVEWYYQLESDHIRTWNDLADAFYKQYEYNAELAPTRMQLQSMSMGRDEKFKEYAQKWRDLAGR